MESLDIAHTIGSRLSGGARETDNEKLILRLTDIGEADALRDALTLSKELMNEDADEVIDSYGNLLTRSENPENLKKAMDYMLLIRKKCASLLKKGDSDAEPIYWESLRLVAQHDFDAFCRYIEKDREPRKRFYEPRRKQLLPIAKAMQRLEDNELDLLAISMPPGTGKSTLEIFFLTWVSGLHPDMQNLMGSHNVEFLRGVFDECLRIFDRDGEYRWADVFNGTGVTKQNAKNLRIDLGRPKRFETIELSSVGSGMAGKVRATAYLILDDLCQGIEQALSVDRMNKLWQAYTVDYRQRKLGDRVKELHIQTRWSVNDVCGRLQELYQDDPRALFINIPALNEDGESNFDYPYGLGYTKEMLADIEQSFDDASFKALYMGQPIEREGLLYNAEELRRYFELPEREPDSIIAACDTKDRGDDFGVMIVAYQYGTDFYVEDVVCDNSKLDIVEAKFLEALIRNKVQMCRIESNAAGGRVAMKLQDQIKERNGITKITTKYNQKNKETRIIMAQPYFQEHFLVKDDSRIKDNRDYKRFVSQLCSYTMAGKNKHDDAPDCASMIVDYVQTFSTGRIQVFQRPF